MAVIKRTFRRTRKNSLLDRTCIFGFSMVDLGGVGKSKKIKANSENSSEFHANSRIWQTAFALAFAFQLEGCMHVEFGIRGIRMEFEFHLRARSWNSSEFNLLNTYFPMLTPMHKLPCKTTQPSVRTYV